MVVIVSSHPDGEMGGMYLADGPGQLCLQEHPPLQLWHPERNMRTN